MKKSLDQVLLVVDPFKRLTTKHYNNFSLAYKIAKASKELDGHRDFYMTEEKKIVEAYAVKDENGNVKVLEGNRISFKDQKDAMKFNEDINNLLKTEVDVFEPLHIKQSDFRNGEMDLTPQEIMSLDEFVIFEDEDVPEHQEA